MTIGDEKEINIMIASASDMNQEKINNSSIELPTGAKPNSRIIIMPNLDVNRATVSRNSLFLLHNESRDNLTLMKTKARLGENDRSVPLRSLEGHNYSS